MSQNSRLLELLQSGKTITQGSALTQLQSSRLAARIHELRCLGYEIHTTIVKTASNKRIARYWMPS